MNRLTLGYYFAIAAVWCIVSAIEDVRADMMMRTSLLADKRMQREDVTDGVNGQTHTGE